MDMSRSGYSEDCDDQWALIRWRSWTKESPENRWQRIRNWVENNIKE